MTWPTRRADLGAAAILAGMAILVFYRGLYAPAELIREDAASYYQPYYEFAAREVQAGRLPLWNPYTNLGQPYHAGLQASLFYPLRWPLFFCDFAFGYALLAWVHYFLTGIAAYVLLRVALGVQPVAGLLGALSIAFGGFAMGHLSHLTYFMAYPWFLLTVLFVWLAVQRRQWRWTWWAGGCVGLMALIGAVHLLLVLGVLLGAYVAYHTVFAGVQLVRGSRRPLDVVRPGLVAGGALALGVLIGAVQLWPAYTLSKNSVRQGVSWSYINLACAHPARNSIQLVAPYYFGNARLGYWGEYNYQDMAHYTGIVVLIAATVGLVSLGRERHAWFLVPLAAVGFLVGAGWYLPVYRVLYDFVPGFDQLRNPTRIFWCTELALAGLAALGADRLLARVRRVAPDQQPKPAADRRVRFAAALGAALVVLPLGVGLLQLRAYAAAPETATHWVDDNSAIYKDTWYDNHVRAAQEVPARIIRGLEPAAWTGILAALATCGVLLYLVWRPGPAPRAAGPALVALLIVDLFAFSFGTVQYEDLYHATVGTPPTARWLQENLGIQRYVVVPPDGLPRCYDIEENRALQFGIRNLNGIGGGILDSVPRGQFCTTVRPHRALIDLVGIRYICTAKPVDQMSDLLVHADERWHIYENPSALRPAFFVPRVSKVPSAEYALSLFMKPEADPRIAAFTLEDVPPDTAVSTAQQAAPQTIETVPGHWRITTQADAPAQLIIAEGYDQGWRAAIDGRPAKIYATNSQLMSVAMPAGAATLTLDYDPPEFTKGAIVSGVGVAMLIGLEIARRLLQRRAKPKSA
jgi:hypothetical protein